MLDYEKQGKEIIRLKTLVEGQRKLLETRGMVY